MSTTLTVGATVVTMGPDLFWSDEHTWVPVAQTVERTLSGAIVIDAAVNSEAGRPITLQSRDAQASWQAYSVLQSLKTWWATPGQQMTLVFRGFSYLVVWRHQDDRALEAEPVVDYSDPAGADFYLITLRLMKV